MTDLLSFGRSASRLRVRKSLPLAPGSVPAVQKGPPRCPRAIVWLLTGTMLAGLAPAQDDDEEIIELSPFAVNTSEDSGYYASNAISGSRIDVRIQDLPLTIEVVTSEFIEDTGSSDLRESLRYSAGILLQSQNDAYGSIDNFGGVNNPEGATGAKSDTGFKIRGFVTDNTLRKGFRRQHTTDTVNIDRVEVVRGPSALLYGVGNFGGVVNYLPKMPQEEFLVDLGVGYGSDGWRRGTLDVTGPLPLGFGYRLTAAYEESDDWTELRTHEHFFVSPVLQWKSERTKLTLDFEYGEAEDRGVGFRSVRAPTLVGIPITEADRLETFGFLEFEGEDPRTFRWSGPDTYYLTDSWNLNVELEQRLIEDMYLLVGYNRSHVKFDNRDIFGGIQTFTSGAAETALARVQPLLDTIEAIQIIDGSNSDVRIPVDNAVLQYAWNESEQTTDWDQVRAELNYGKRLFQDSRWLASRHTVLAGFSWESQENGYINYTMEAPNRPTDSDPFLYKNPTDSRPIRFDAPTDGTGTPSFIMSQFGGSIGENEGYYGVYSARFIDERLFFIGGIRRDISSSLDGFNEVFNFSVRNPGFDRADFPDSEVTKDTSQWGVSYEFRNGFTVYALQSEGVEPNFDGQRDGNGVALESSVAESQEVGLKVNLADGKFAATFSLFKIERSGVPFSYWWAPAPARGLFDREADIVYRMDEWDLGAQLQAVENNPALTVNPYLGQARAEWEAAVASGAVFEAVNEFSTNEETFTYLNASTPEGAAYLDAVFAALNAEFAKPRGERDSDPWAGWLFAGREPGEDSNVNFAGLDYSAPSAFYQSISDQSEGWEAQVIWSPIEQFQMVLNYSNVERTVTNPGSFVTYPYVEGNWDRWAYWYYPNSNWGLAGVQPEEAYPGGPDGLPNQDTSTWTGVGWGQGEALDDTPKHAVSWWATWRFKRDTPLDGLQLGLGGSWMSEREYASAFTSAGQRKQNETGTSIKAVTDPRLTINAMVKYFWAMGKNDGVDAFVQLNVDNLLDDTDQYGLIYAPGLSWRFQTGLQF